MANNDEEKETNDEDPRDAYALRELIGIGSFGAVYKAFFLKGDDDENDDLYGDEMMMFGNENERQRSRRDPRAIKILPFVENNGGNNLASSSENNSNNNNN